MLVAGCSYACIHLEPVPKMILKWATLTKCAVQAYCGNISQCQGNELTLNSSGNTHLQLAQPAKPLWTDPPSLNSGIGAQGLIIN